MKRVDLLSRTPAHPRGMAAANGVQIGEEILADARALLVWIDTDADV